MGTLFSGVIYFKPKLNRLYSFLKSTDYCFLLFSARREMIKVGDRVRVKPSVTTPKYKWGSVNHGSVGTVVSISPNGKDVKVDFPQQTNWTGLISEMEVVPATHPRVRSELVCLLFLLRKCCFGHKLNESCF